MSPGFYAACFALASGITLSSSSEPASRCILVPLPKQPTDGAIYFRSAVLDSSQEENSSRVNIDPLRLILINSEPEYDTLVFYVSSVFSSTSSSGGACSEVLGVVGDLSSKTARIIHHLASRANLNVTLVSAVAPSSFLPVTNLGLPNVLDALDMNPLTHYVEALVAFCEQLNWTRISLISGDTVYDQFAAELLKKSFLQNKPNEIIPYVTLSKAGNLLKAFDEIKAHGTHIIVVLTMNGQNACLLMEAAHSQGLVWPEYAWMVLDFNSNEETRTCYQKDVILFNDRAITGEAHNPTFPCNNDSVLCIRLYETETNMSLDSLRFLNSLSFLVSSGFFTAHKKDVLESVLLTDSVDSLDSSNATVYGFRSGEVNFKEGKRLNNIDIYQVKNFSRIEVAYYNASLEDLEMLHKDFYTFLLEGNGPQGSKLVIKYRTLDKFFLGVVLAFDYLFITTTFALYIYFRREPEIKATSVTVSLSMFLGCYLMLAYVPLYHAVHQKPLKHGKVACHALLWLCAAGLSMSLVLSTLIAKMIRVYTIFIKPLSYKKKFFSDSFLGLYIILMISPNVFVLILWLALNPLDIREVVIDYKSYTFVTQFCLAKNSELPWYIGLILHTMTLLAALIILAFKSADIRHKHFQDAKETNAFAFIVVFTIAIAFFYWWFHLFVLPQSQTSFKAAEITAYVAHVIIVTSCQIYLFVPKIYPPLKRLQLHQKNFQSIRTSLDK